MNLKYLILHILVTYGNLHHLYLNKNWSLLRGNAQVQPHHQHLLVWNLHLQPLIQTSAQAVAVWQRNWNPPAPGTQFGTFQKLENMILLQSLQLHTVWTTNLITSPPKPILTLALFPRLIPNQELLLQLMSLTLQHQLHTDLWQRMKRKTKKLYQWKIKVHQVLVT